MKNRVKRVLSAVILICMLAAFYVPAVYATNSLEPVVYNFDLANDYNALPKDPEGKSSSVAYAITGNLGSSKVQTSIPDRFSSGNLNWTYESGSAGVCGDTTENEHLPITSKVRFAKRAGLRAVIPQGDWIAFRIKSPGAGEHAMDLTFYGYGNDPTVAVYVIEAEGTASIDHDTVLVRRETIHAAMDPDNRVGKASLYAGTVEQANTAFIGNWIFEADKEYIVVVENYQNAPISGSYTCLQTLTLTPGAKDGTQLEGAPFANSVLVQKNVVPASDGGAMGTLWEVNGHDYFFLPLEGGKMAIFDLDTWSLVKTVTTGRSYPTSATVTQDGTVIIGADGKRIYIFDTATMTGELSPDFRNTEGLQDEAHVQGVYAGSDGKIYFGTLYGGHLVQYDLGSKTYLDLGDLVCKEVQQMVFPDITDEEVEDNGGVNSVLDYDGYLYAVTNTTNYSILVKYDLNTRQAVGALDIRGDGLEAGKVSRLGEKYLIVGGGDMNLVDIATFTLVDYESATGEMGLFDGKSSKAQDAWENGMTGHATEVVDGKQYFVISGAGVYSYEVATGKMAYVGGGNSPFRTGAKTTVTLDRNGDGEEELYLFSYAGTPVNPRLYDPNVCKKIATSGLMQEEYGTGGSKINIGTWYDDVLYIGAWNNWNCAAFDTKTETFSSRYVTGGQTDSQTHYVDDDGKFHLISGNYSACVVYEIDPINKTGYNGDADSNIIKPLIANMKKYDQKRIHTVAAGDGYVFAGTIPDSYKHGGGVGVYNTETETEDFIHFKQNPTLNEKCVPAEYSELWDLAVKGIVYSDGRLYGATTRAGGSGAEYSVGTSAQVFVLDYENMAIEATLDLRDYLTLVDANKDGVEDPIDFVGGLSVDEQGRIWGIVSDVLFCFTYDKATKDFTVQEVLSLGISEYETSGGVGQKNRAVIFDPEHSSLFIGFFQYGTRQVFLTDWDAPVGEIHVSSHQRILTGAPTTYVLSENNNLYYNSGPDLYMKAVNVTEGEWAAAGALDAQIKAFGKITVESAGNVAAARETYNNLSLRDRSLVQELRTLLEAEAQVLEMQIAEAVSNVTGESTQQLQELLLQYENLESNQKRYVQNYPALEEAYDDALQMEKDAKIDAVQAQIDALPETVALSDEAAVTAARQAYDTLTEAQKATVDATKLIAAEAQIAILKDAATVQEQINALPDEIVWGNKTAVEAARDAYNALSAETQVEVDTTKLVAAEARIAELRQIRNVQAQIDALPDEIVIQDKYAIKAARAAYEALTDELKEDVDTAKLVAAEEALADLANNAIPTQQVYDFQIYENPAFYTDCTKYTYDVAVGRIPSNMVASKTYNSTYSTIAKWFYASYAKSINWGIELSEGSETAYTFRGSDDQGMRMTSVTAAGKYGSLRIFVPTAGTYTFDFEAGNVIIGADVYVIPANTVYASARTSAGTITAAMTEENYIGSINLNSSGVAIAAGTYTFPAAGDYIVIFKATRASSDNGVSLRTITLNPVIDETTAVAKVGEELFLSLEDAIAYQIENNAQAVKLNKDAAVADLKLESGAVVDLNGKTLTVDSVVSYASSGIVDSSEKDTGVLVIKDADGNMLSCDNAQLPTYDAAAGGLRFFEIRVKSVAITGKGGANPKYWFQVSCVNFEEIHKLIQAGSEMNVTVKMRWDGGEADAVASVEFLNKWAEKYATGDNFYITVTAVNAEGLEDFSLTPCMAANGVTVKGSEM